MVSSPFFSITAFEIQSRFCVKLLVYFWKTASLGETCHYRMHICGGKNVTRIYYFSFYIVFNIKILSSSAKYRKFTLGGYL